MIIPEEYRNLALLKMWQLINSNPDCIIAESPHGKVARDENGNELTIMKDYICFKAKDKK